MYADNLKSAGIRLGLGRDGKDRLLNIPLAVSFSDENQSKKYIDKRYIV
jgi:hypothetical protein